MTAAGVEPAGRTSSAQLVKGDIFDRSLSGAADAGEALLEQGYAKGQGQPSRLLVRAGPERGATGPAWGRWALALPAAQGSRLGAPRPLLDHY